ncbi:TPA: HaeIII family restriction endonuclease [Streptococcus pneumoniae]
MSKGKAFEYATAISFYNYINQHGGTAQIVNDINFQNVKNCFNILNNLEQDELLNVAMIGCIEVFNLEPTLQNMNDILTITIAPDFFGQTGDVRDVILTKSNWEIGISCKHNHQALKHQRLSNRIDFGQEWAGYPVSQNYWNTIEPVFQMLQNFKDNGVRWRDLSNHGVSKENDVYIPLLTSFLDEFNLLDNTYSNLAPRFLEYLAGRRDFYKFVMNESRSELNIYCYNLHGELGDGGGLVPIIPLPTRFTRKDWKVNRDGTISNNTLIIEMDNNWVVGLRLHSAANLVETSLKFDSQPISIPQNLLIISVQY